MIQNTDYRENKGVFDVCLFDPPFDEWKNIDYIPKAKTYVCFTNFQNRHYVDKLFGVPKFEMIWHFKDGRWVSHKMPRHTHEHILIYGELKNEAYTGEYNIDRTPKKKGKGSIGNDFIADVSKSFAVGKIIEIVDNIYGHQFNKGELVRIIRHDSSSAARWLCSNTRSEYWLSEREANVC